MDTVQYAISDRNNAQGMFDHFTTSNMQLLIVTMHGALYLYIYFKLLAISDYHNTQCIVSLLFKLSYQGAATTQVSI